MTTRKRSQKVNKPLYVPEQKVYFITEHKGKLEDIFEGRIISRNTIEFVPTDELGNKLPPIAEFSYAVKTIDGISEVRESGIFSTFAKAAHEFAKHFLILIK